MVVNTSYNTLLDEVNGIVGDAVRSRDLECLFPFAFALNGSNVELSTDTTEHFSSIMQAASAALLFEATLNGTIGSVLTPITQISADVFRPDVPYGNATLFYLSPDGIAAAGSFVPPAGQR